jgi:ribonuclease P protein component
VKHETLPKTERLCSRKQLTALMDKGTVLFHFPFKVFFSITPFVTGAPCCQMAVTVPKRNFKKAVTRNLLKRRMREAFRKNKTIFYETLHAQNKAVFIFFHYVSPKILTYADIESNLQKSLEKLAQTVVAGSSVSVDTVG